MVPSSPSPCTAAMVRPARDKRPVMMLRLYMVNEKWKNKVLVCCRIKIHTMGTAQMIYAESEGRIKNYAKGPSMPR